MATQWLSIPCTCVSETLLAHSCTDGSVEDATLEEQDPVTYQCKEGNKDVTLGCASSVRA